MTISIGNIEDAQFSDKQKKNSIGYQAGTGELFNTNPTGSQTYSDNINILNKNNADPTSKEVLYNKKIQKQKKKVMR